MKINSELSRLFSPLSFEAAAKPAAEKPPRPKRVKQKNDPKLVAAAWELRDRWMEQVNADESLLLPAGSMTCRRPGAKSKGAGRWRGRVFRHRRSISSPKCLPAPRRSQREPRRVQP
jgi:hypothetical protein